MPLPESFFEAKDTIDKTEEYQTPETIKVEDELDPFDFPDGLLSDDDEVQINSLIRKKTVIQETYFKQAEAVSFDANTGCTIYKVHYEGKQFIRYYLVRGMDEYLVKEEPKGQYQIDRYIQHCANRQITVTEWHENPAIGTDHHDGELPDGEDPSFEESEKLVKKQEGDDGVNPPPSTGDLDDGSGTGGGAPPPATPPAPRRGPRFWVPAHVLQRVFAAHGFVERYNEGNHSVLKEAIWMVAGPVRVEGCYVTVMYNAAWRITKWRLSDGARASRETVFIEPRVVNTRIFLIPGCDPNKPISVRRQSILDTVRKKTRCVFGPFVSV